jgi:hypothetical protein
MPTVTPDVIADVAKEFRLDVVSSPETEKSGTQNQMDLLKAIKAMIDLYGVLQKPFASGLELGAPVTVEASKHEPNI